ncbi:putative glucosyltransferase Lgt1 [Legionella geestiana]|uniref:Putative glucosyltransferase Lgt1 n=1 Tax=Legionella geestiana TaxID=45065 RepID=A0A0W0U966_9GAMM|nr:glycosyltransferase family 88 protein [Legionella geestiana]KTD04246.1 putative glucosyltransferase Lgt1 [Legionella geestiana]QBS11665.1 hypothetical protein E4T54_02310 [Legionella geestiana]QDQ40724.1 hypothetical protein E3226_010110 [Legionella geestiana]STX53649.1 putative glucosyltransferase Lgt1 [Legionella geestiana]
MPLLLNPHRHVKIWLSTNPHVFMSTVNQARMMLMRAMNPNEEIYLVYESRLLTPAAIQGLKDFCAQLNIRAKDAKTLLKKYRSEGIEQGLIALYEDNINNFAQGGNPGAASDILRVLEPVWKLGIYSDMDVLVNTATLPARIEVQRDILMTIRYTDENGERLGHLNTDIFAVLDTPEARTQLKFIQKAIARLSAPHTDWESVFDGMWPELQKRLPRELLTRKAGISAREMRGWIERVARDDEGLKFILMRTNVLQTSGPGLVGNVIMSAAEHMDWELFMNRLEPVAIDYYEGLSDALITQNNPQTGVSGGNNVVLPFDEKGRIGTDSSWTPMGKYITAWREGMLKRPSKLAFKSDAGVVNMHYPVTDLSVLDNAPIPQADILAKHASNHLSMLYVASDLLPAEKWVGQRLVLSDCYESRPGTKFCVTTNARFFAPGIGERNTDSPVPFIDYACTKTSSGVNCTGEALVRLSEGLSPAVDMPPRFLIQTMGSAALVGMASGFLPGMLADTLLLSGFSSRENAAKLKLATQILLLMMFSSWASMVVMVSVTIACRAAGLKPDMEKAASMGISLAMGLGAQTTTVGVASMAAGMAGSFFGSHLERRIAGAVESRLRAPDDARSSAPAR